MPDTLPAPTVIVSCGFHDNDVLEDRDSPVQLNAVRPDDIAVAVAWPGTHAFAPRPLDAVAVPDRYAMELVGTRSAEEPPPVVNAVAVTVAVQVASWANVDAVVTVMVPRLAVIVRAPVVNDPKDAADGTEMDSPGAAA
jgi:hypothetical protein